MDFNEYVASVESRADENEAALLDAFGKHYAAELDRLLGQADPVRWTGWRGTSDAGHPPTTSTPRSKPGYSPHTTAYVTCADTPTPSR